MQTFLIGLVGQLISMITGGIGGAISMVTGLIKSGFNAVVQYNQAGIALSRQIGLNAREAQAYTQVLITRAKELGHEYGITAEQVLELQKNLSSATGRALMLNNQEAERMVQINKLVGAEVSNQFASEMMNHMGAQLSTVQGAVSKAYATAAKSGLNAAQFSEKVAKNLTLANKLSFRDGVNGIIRMTALSEKLGFNLQSVEGAANKFMELQDSISNAAQLQMLGGAAGAYGGNPLEMAYEANYDPEAFTGRMTKMLGGYAQFDIKTGMANVNGMNRDFVKNIASAMGIGFEEAMSIAKKQAEVKYKENAYGRELGGISKENRDFVLNKSYVDANTRHLMFNDVSGGTHDITENGLDNAIIEEMKKFDAMTDSDIMKSQAQSLKSIQERISGWETSLSASIAKAIQDSLPEIEHLIDKLGLDAVTKLAPAINDFIGGAKEWFNEHRSTLKTIYDTIVKLVVGPIKWASNHVGLIFALLASGKLLKGIMGMPFGKGTVGGAILSKMFSKGGGAAAAAASNGGKILSTVGKFAKVGGAALGVGIGLHKAFTADDNAGRGEGIGTAVGSVIGTAIGGPIGAAVGGWLGGVGGKMIGKHWEQIKDFAKGAWSDIKDFAKSTWDGIKGLAKGVWNLIPEDAKNALSSGINAVAPIAKVVWDVIKGYAKGAWSAISGFAVGSWNIIKGSALGVWNVIKGAGLGVWEVIKGFAKGVWEVIKGGWNAIWDIISAPFNAIGDVVEGIKTGFNQILDGNIIDGILTMFKGIGAGVLDILLAPFKATGDFAKGMLNGIGEVAIGVWKGVGETAKGIWNGIGEFVKGIWSGVGSFVKGLWGGILNIWYGIVKGLNHLPFFNIDIPEEYRASGGIVGGNSYTGDKIITGLNSGEMVLNQDQQSQLFNFIGNASNILTKLSSSNGVTYYSTSNNVRPSNVVNNPLYSSNGISYNSTSNTNKSSVVSTPLYSSNGVTYYSANNIDESNVLSSYSPNSSNVWNETTSIRQKHADIRSNEKFNTLSNILSTVFNSNSNVVASALDTNNDRIKTTPFGENSFRKIPKDNAVVNGGLTTSEVKVNDINLNIGGTIKLDAGNYTKNIDINQLLNDSTFISMLKEQIKDSINNDMNGGRFMTDTSILRGSVSPTTYWGR